MKEKKMHGWGVIWPDHTRISARNKLWLQLSQHNALFMVCTASKAENWHPPFEGVFTENCSSPSHLLNLQLPAVLIAEAYKWALHNPQKAESTKLNWTTSDNKLSWSIFLMLITQHSRAPFSWQSCTWGQPSVLVKQQEAVRKGRQGSLSSTWATVC